MMYKKLLFASVVFASLFLLATYVEATAIYTQGPTPNTFSRSDEPDFGKREADDFELTSADTVRSVGWQGIYFPSGTPLATDNFTLYFYADSGNIPGALLASFNVGNAVNRNSVGTLDGRPLFNYRADIGTGLPVAASTKTWLSVVNNTSGDARDWAWATEFPTTPVLAQSHRSSDSGATWPEAFNEILAFTLHNDFVVPEPSAILLAVVGVFMLRRSFPRVHG